MLVWSRGSRRGVIAVFLALLIVLLVAPLLVVLVASFAGSWNTVLPTKFTIDHLRAALDADNRASLLTSIQTALIAGVVSVVVGTWAALSAAQLPRKLRSAVDTFFHLPVAVPSVVIGLGMLVAFSQGPILLNGTKWIVIVAQTLLVLSFAYSSVSAALVRLDPQIMQVAHSLGASPARALIRVQLPMLLPAITGATALAVALCMGELGATIMIYPPSWRTLPVTIFSLSDRGDTYLASANTLVLLISTFLLLALISRVRMGPYGAGRN